MSGNEDGKEEGGGREGGREGVRRRQRMGNRNGKEIGRGGDGDRLPLSAPFRRIIFFEALSGRGGNSSSSSSSSNNSWVIRWRVMIAWLVLFCLSVCLSINLSKIAAFPVLHGRAPVVVIDINHNL